MAINGTSGNDNIIDTGGNDSINGGAGSDTITAGSSGSSDVVRGGAGNDKLIATTGTVTFLYDNSNNGFDQFTNGSGTSIAEAEANGTVIGVSGFNNGVDVIDGNGFSDVVVRDTSSANVLNFKNTVLNDISEIDAAGGSDTITTSDLSDGTYRGGAGDDNISTGSKNAILLYDGTGNGFDTFALNGTGYSMALAQSNGTIIGIGGNFINGIDEFSAGVSAGVTIQASVIDNTLNFANTVLTGITEINAGNGNDVITTSDISDGNYRGGSGDDKFYTGSADAVLHYNGIADGYDTFALNGTGYSKAIAESDGTVIGLGVAYNNGIDEFSANGFSSVIIKSVGDNDALNFSFTKLTNITEIDSGGRADTVRTALSSLTTGDLLYNGGGGVDTLQVAITLAQSHDASVLADLTNYQGWLTGGNSAVTFTLSSLGFSAVNFERLVAVVVDSPEITDGSSVGITDTLVETNSGLTTSGALTVVDSDLAESVTPSVVSVVASGDTAGLLSGNAALLAMLSVSPASIAADAGDTDNLHWSFDSLSESFDYLNVGLSLILTYTVRATNNIGVYDDHTVTITIDGTDDAPVNAVPVAPATDEDTVLVFSSGNGNLISFSDVDDTSHTVTLTATNGAFSLAGVPGPQITTMTTITGSDASIKALLDGLAFAPTANFNGIASLQIQTSDGVLSDTDTINITVNAVNDAPVAHTDDWILSDTSIPTGVITSDWFTHNDSDPENDTLYVTAVTGLSGTGLTAHFDGSGHLTSIDGTATTTGQPFALGYTLSDGGLTVNSSVTLHVLHTTTGANSLGTLNNNDFSYINLQDGGDQVSGDASLSGNAGIDYFVGSNGNDTLDGGAGNDSIDGGANNDLLTGGDGADSLTGGLNTDTFAWNKTSEFGDTVTDYLAGTDKFRFDAGATGSQISIGNNDTIVDYNEGNDATINVAGNEVNVKTDASVAAASIQSTIDGYTNITTGGLFVFLETGGHAVMYYDSNPSVAGGALLVADLTNITTLVGVANLSSTDFTFV